MRKRIGLVVTLFHEAGKAVHAMPYLVFIPLLVNIVCAFLRIKLNLKYSLLYKH